MTEIIIGSAVLSMLHALLPNHWLPIIAIGQQQKWTLRQTLVVTLIGALAHSLSTILIGVAMGYLGHTLSMNFEIFISIIAPAILIGMGLFFIYQHHAHHHFHISTKKLAKITSKWKFILAITIAMMFSPCLEISGYFLYAGAKGLENIALIAILYAACTVVGMLIWVWWLYPHVQKLDWHALEHKAGLVAGWILLITGVMSFFLH
jgi:hypothetical protein